MEGNNTISSYALPAPKEKEKSWERIEEDRSSGRKIGNMKSSGLITLSRQRELIPSSTWQIDPNPRYHTTGPGPAFDKDMRSGAVVVLANSGKSGGHPHEIGWQAKFDEVVYITTVSAESYF